MRVGINGEPGFYAEGDCTFEVCRQLDLLDWDQPYEWLQERYDAVLFDELHDLDEGALMVLRKLVHGNNGILSAPGTSTSISTKVLFPSLASRCSASRPISLKIPRF